MKNYLWTALFLAAATTTLLNPSHSIMGGGVNAEKTKSTLLQRPVRYDRERVVRLSRNQPLLDAILSLNLDIWGHTEKNIDVRVSSRQFHQLNSMVQTNEFHLIKVVEADVQALIDQETERLNQRIIKEQHEEETGEDTDEANEALADYFSDYHRYEEIIQWLKNLSEAYPNLVEFTPSIGKSVEGRDIPMIKISNGKTTTSSNTKKRSLWIQGMQHAREWISGATVQYFASYLTSEYSSASDNNQRVRTLLDNVDFYMVPMSNPDGYAYTWTNDRLWRKNRQMIKGRKTGVDLNRNWPEHWGEHGSSSDPTKDTYAGPSPASEPEVRALMAMFKRLPNACGAIDMHSYSQLLLRPYGWTRSQSYDEAAFVSLHKNMQQDIEQVAGTKYIVQPGVDLYFVAGGSRDWFYDNSTRVGEQKKYSITIELSPDADDDEGFVLPPERIIPVGKEIVPALLTYAETCYQKPLGLKTTADEQLK